MIDKKTEACEAARTKDVKKRRKSGESVVCIRLNQGIGTDRQRQALHGR